jgi:hypothetical protein
VKTVLLFLLNIVVRLVIVGVLCGSGYSLMTETKNKFLKILGFVIGMIGLYLVWYWIGCAFYWSRA